MRYILLAGSLIILLFSCNKNREKAGKNVELYLLGSYRWVTGQCKVDSSQVVLESSPFIKNEDFLQYNSHSYQFTLTGSAHEKLRKLPGRTPFAVTVDKKVIYFGVYMPLYMSSVCFNSITMAESWDQPAGISINLASPGTMGGAGIDDQRNNPILLATLKSQGKLR
jgi:hypothetical protein